MEIGNDILDTFTEPEAGSPVPVRFVGARTDPSRSSTHNCLASLVGNQARMQENTTGTKPKENVDPFKRSERIRRSPERERRGSLPLTTKEYLERGVQISTNKALSRNALDVYASHELEEPNREVKRKRVQTPEKIESEELDRLFLEKARKEHYMYEMLIEKIGKEIETLQKVIKEIPNTKKEIKNSVSHLEDFFKRLPGSSRFINEIMEKITTKDIQGKGKETSEACTQTKSKKEEEMENLKNQIISELERELDKQEFHEITNKKWPEEVFENCKLAKGKPLVTENEDLLIVVNEKVEGQEEIIRTLKLRY